VIFKDFISLVFSCFPSSRSNTWNYICNSAWFVLDNSSLNGCLFLKLFNFGFNLLSWFFLGGLLFFFWGFIWLKFLINIKFFTCEFVNFFIKFQFIFDIEVFWELLHDRCFLWFSSCLNSFNRIHDCWYRISNSLDLISCVTFLIDFGGSLDNSWNNLSSFIDSILYIWVCIKSFVSFILKIVSKIISDFWNYICDCIGLCLCMNCLNWNFSLIIWFLSLFSCFTNFFSVINSFSCFLQSFLSCWLLFLLFRDFIVLELFCNIKFFTSEFVNLFIKFQFISDIEVFWELFLLRSEWLTNLSFRLNGVHNCWYRISNSLNLISGILLLFSLFDGISYLWGYLGCGINCILDIWVLVKGIVDFVFNHLSNIGGNIWNHICYSWVRFLSLWLLVNFLRFLFGLFLLCLIVLKFLIDVKIFSCVLINFSIYLSFTFSIEIFWEFLYQLQVGFVLD